MHSVSEQLRTFVDEFPAERAPILEFLAAEAAKLPPEAWILDIGAGDAPYRELFAHANYVTSDWAASQHARAGDADILAPAEDIPRPDASFDCVVLTQVLEHVPAPHDVVAECHRLLRPGGQLLVTVPMTWELHETPHDFYRYTAFGLEHLLVTAGFRVEFLRPRGSSLATIASLIANVAWAALQDPGVPDEVSHRLQPIIAELDELDHPNLDQLSLGYQAIGRRPQ